MGHSKHHISVVASAKALLRVPDEIACQIIDDVPVYRILQMAASLTEPAAFKAFTKLLLSLPRTGGSFFPTDRHTISMIELYRKYYALALNSRRPVSPSHSPLAMSFNSSRALSFALLGKRQQMQKEWLVSEIWRMLRDLQWSDESLPDLGIYRGAKDSEATLEQYQKALVTRASIFNGPRAGQIEAMRKLYTDYPGMSQPPFELHPFTIPIDFSQTS